MSQWDVKIEAYLYNRNKVSIINQKCESEHIFLEKKHKGKMLSLDIGDSHVVREDLDCSFVVEEDIDGLNMVRGDMDG